MTLALTPAPPTAVGSSLARRRAWRRSPRRSRCRRARRASAPSASAPVELDRRPAVRVRRPMSVAALARADERRRPRDAAFRRRVKDATKAGAVAPDADLRPRRRRSRPGGIAAPRQSHGRDRSRCVEPAGRCSSVHDTMWTMRRCPRWPARSPRDVAKAIGASPRPGAVRRPADHLSAYEAYQRGRLLMPKSATSIAQARASRFRPGRRARPRLRGAVGGQGRRLHRRGGRGVRGADAARGAPAREGVGCSARSS